MKRLVWEFAIVCILAFYALFPSSIVLGQQEVAAANQDDAKYVFEPSRGMKNVDKDLVRVTELLDQAIRENASELVIAKLRAAYAETAFQLGRVKGDWKPFYEATDEILKDPSSFLNNLELALLYRNIVNLQRGQLRDQTESQFKAIRVALDNIAEAMTLTEFERAYVSGLLRRDAHGMAHSIGDLDLLLEWNGPVLDHAEVLMTQKDGEELYFAAVQVQMFYLNELGLQKELFEVYEAVSNRIATSNSISDYLKLVRRRQLLHEQLEYSSANHDSEEAKKVWDDAVAYINSLKEYEGEYPLDVQAGEIWVKLGMFGFLRGRDLNKSIDLLNSVFEKSKTNPKLYQWSSAVNNTIGCAKVTLWRLARINDPRSHDVYRQTVEYLKTVESNKGFDTNLDLANYTTELDELLKMPGHSVD